MVRLHHCVRCVSVILGIFLLARTSIKQRIKSKSGVYMVFCFNNIGIFLYRQIERNRVFGESESAIRIDENDALPW